WAPASLGTDGLFATAYHIKVAVWSDAKDPGATRFWLSSGNWQSSNQPNKNRKLSEIAGIKWEEVADYNREWHAVVESKALASTFRAHLEQDYVDNAAEAAREAVVALNVDILVPEAMLELPKQVRDYKPFEPLQISGKIRVLPLLTPDNYPEEIVKL